MPDVSNSPTTSSAVIAVICVVLVVGLCLAGFAQWFCRQRRQSRSSARDHPVLPIYRLTQPQTTEVQKQPQPLPTKDDLSRLLPIMDYKMWKEQQIHARANSVKLAAENALTAVSNLEISTPASISSAEHHVYLLPIKRAIAEVGITDTDASSKKQSRLELSQSSDIIETYLPAARQKKNQSASDVEFSNYSCAICLSIIEDGVYVRGLPCGHAFHVDCIDKWLIWRQRCCPLCKAPYQKSSGEA